MRDFQQGEFVKLYFAYGGIPVKAQVDSVLKNGCYVTWTRGNEKRRERFSADGREWGTGNSWRYNYIRNGFTETQIDQDIASLRAQKNEQQNRVGMIHQLEKTEWRHMSNEQLMAVIAVLPVKEKPTETFAAGTSVADKAGVSSVPNAVKTRTV